MSMGSACFIRVVNKEIEVRIRQLALEKTSQPYRPACSLEESVDAHSDTPFLDRSDPFRKHHQDMRQGTSDARNASQSA